jgi:hypothetical protein
MTTEEFANEYIKKAWKRQHGMLRCIICGKKLKRLPSYLFEVKKINGKICMVYHSEYSGHMGWDTIDKHIRCMNLK